jgi:hypothetical protein
MLPSHLEVMDSIEKCRTEAMGGHAYYCETCKEPRYSYHSCKNRHCPKCQNDQAQVWLEGQKHFLLPLVYFMVTFTLPEELRDIVSRNQKLLYDILFRSSAEALQELAKDPRLIGGLIGMVGVLQTWTRDLWYHPHVHYLVPGGALACDGSKWLPSRKNFFLHEKPLSILFRAKFRDELKKTDLFLQVDPNAWKKDWVVDCEPVGSGEEAFEYLAPYIFRVAITNNRIRKLENGKVTFEYKESDTGKLKLRTISAEEFIRRFLCHVLPDRFVKVRYYGFMAPANRHLLKRVRVLLAAASIKAKTKADSSDAKEQNDVPRCPKCGTILIHLEVLKPMAGLPP